MFTRLQTRGRITSAGSNVGKPRVEKRPASKVLQHFINELRTPYPYILFNHGLLRFSHCYFTIPISHVGLLSGLERSLFGTIDVARIADPGFHLIIHCDDADFTPPILLKNLALVSSTVSRREWFEQRGPHERRFRSLW